MIAQYKQGFIYIVKQHKQLLQLLRDILIRTKEAIIVEHNA